MELALIKEMSNDTEYIVYSVWYGLELTRKRLVISAYAGILCDGEKRRDG